MNITARIKQIPWGKYMWFPLMGLAILPGLCSITTIGFSDVEGAFQVLIYFILGDSCLVLAAISLLQIYNTEQKKIKWNMHGKAGAVFLLWALLSCIFAKDPLLAFYGEDYRMEGYMGLLLYASFYLLGRKMKEGKHLRRFLFCFVAASAPVSCVYWLQKLEFAFPYCEMAAHDAAIFLHHNHYGYYLVLILLCCQGCFVYYELSFAKKAFIFILFCINGVTLAANDTMGAILAVFLALIFQLILLIVCFRVLKMEHFGNRIKKAFVMLLLFVLLLGVYNIYSGNMTANCESLTKDIGSITSGENVDSIGTGRGVLWKKAVQYIKERPLLGYGPDGLSALYHADGFRQDRPANEYLQYAGFFGIPGLAFYLLFLITGILPKFRKLKELTCAGFLSGIVVLGYLCSALFGNTVYYTTCYFAIFLGILCGDST